MVPFKVVVGFVVAIAQMGDSVEKQTGHLSNPSFMWIGNRWKIDGFLEVLP
jgi:hypothetical protein